jgi:hypothetical protein
MQPLEAFCQMQTSQRNIDLAQRFIDRVRSDPVWCAREVLNHRVKKGEKTLDEDPDRSWELDKFQIDGINAVFDVWRKREGLTPVINVEGKNYISIRSGHGPGKTHLAALIGSLFATAFPARVICTAPKMQQLRSRLWGAFRKIDARAEPWWRGTHVINDSAIYWLRPDSRGKLVEDKNWCVLAETAVQPENLAGHHERFQLVIVDEATGVPEDIYPVIFGALSSGEIQILLMISNPTKNTGTFAFSHLSSRESKDYFTYHINLQNAKRINRAWVAKMENKYGKDSPIVKIRVHGEFADASPRQLIATAWMMAAIERTVRPSDGSVPHLRIAIDVADGGQDETVVGAKLIFQSFHVMLKVKRFNFPMVDAIARAADAAEQLFISLGGNKRRDDFVVDSLGVGAGCRDMLIRRGYSVVEYMGGASSDDPERWRNRRVQSYLCLRDAFRDGTLDIAEDCFDSSEDVDEALAQLASIELSGTVTGERLEDLVTKTKMKEDGIPSPDIADMFAMQYATQAPAIALPDGMSIASTLTAIPGSGVWSGMNAGNGGAV